MGIRFAAGVNLGFAPGISLGGRRGAADPLAGFTFLLRAQARGSNLGLWKDVAATLPVSIGDLVAASTDAYGTGGIIYTQATSGIRPSYVLGSDAKPVLQFDGVGTRLIPPAGNILPASIFILVKNTASVVDFNNHYVFVDDLFNNNRVVMSAVPPVGFWQLNTAIGGGFTIGTPTAGYDLIEVQADPGACYTALNGVTTPQTDFAFQNLTYFIGSTSAGGSPLQADMVAMLMLAAPVTAGQRTTISNYLLSLL